jgi:hypothetical protein
MQSSHEYIPVKDPRNPRQAFERRVKVERDKRDLFILNKKADKLNKEAEDVLSYQVDYETR